MLYLGIDQHARQLTVSLRNEEGNVVEARQVSTEPTKVNAFFARLTRETASRGESFGAVLEFADSTTGCCGCSRTTAARR